MPQVLFVFHKLIPPSPRFPQVYCFQGPQPPPPLSRKGKRKELEAFPYGPYGTTVKSKGRPPKSSKAGIQFNKKSNQYSSKRKATSDNDEEPKKRKGRPAKSKETEPLKIQTRLDLSL